MSFRCRKGEEGARNYFWFCSAVFAIMILAFFVFQPDTAIHAEQNAAENPVKDGLVKENGCYCFYEDGQRLTNSWVTAGNDTYYFRWDGQASVLSCKIGDTYYVFDSKGRLIQPDQPEIVQIQTGNGKVKKYYVDADGAARSGWSGDKNYYFDECGEMVTGAAVLKGKFYYFENEGKYNKSKTKKLRKAAVYEKPFSVVKKYIGSPRKTEYYASCYGKGDDGILIYDNFTVYTFRPKQGDEIFMGAE